MINPNPPHILEKTTTKDIMLDVIKALIPATLFYVLFFGLDALLVISTSIASCIAFEYLYCIYILKGKNNTKDLSAVVTGFLLAFCVPSSIPLWMIVIGAFFSIVIVKMSFGGLGMNIFNPALSGRAFLFLSFPAQLSSWTKPQMYEFFNPSLDVAVESSSVTNTNNYDVLNELSSYLHSVLDVMFSNAGEILAFSLIIGFVYLLYKRIISWHIPVTFVFTFFIVMFIKNKDLVNNFEYLSYLHILTGGLLLGAIFMATDYATSPMTNKGKIIFAIGCGVLTVFIKSGSNYINAVCFSILIMNAFVPIIDKITTPTIFGIGRRGR